MKFPNRNQLLPQIKKWRNEGYKITFTSGSFDILHRGHVTYLESASRYAMEHDQQQSKLVVGVNSDQSVKSYKDPSRPINQEKDRATVLVALKSVDACFIFDELDNKENILAIKPDYYLKAGDYDPNNPKSMTSAQLLKDWEGKADVVSFESGYSTTQIIERVLLSYSENYQNNLPRSIRSEQELIEKRRPAIFLDRDGVINQEVSYLHQTSELEFIPGALEGMKILYDLGYKLIIVTNQPGIGLGYFSKSDFFKFSLSMFKVISKNDILIDKVYFCPHSKSEGCNCRKPKSRMITRARDEANIDLEKSYMIGDRTTDIKAGARENLITVLVKTGYGGKDEEYDITPDHTADDLLQAARWIADRTDNRTAPPVKEPS